MEYGNFKLAYIVFLLRNHRRHRHRHRLPFAVSFASNRFMHFPCIRFRTGIYAIKRGTPGSLSSSSLSTTSQIYTPGNNKHSFLLRHTKQKPLFCIFQPPITHKNSYPVGQFAKKAPKKFIIPQTKFIQTGTTDRKMHFKWIWNKKKYFFQIMLKVIQFNRWLHTLDWLSKRTIVVAQVGCRRSIPFFWFGNFPRKKLSRTENGFAILCIPHCGKIVF